MRISSRAIIFKEDKILLIYREKEKERYYVFPGGKIEIGENNEQCVIRECMEELGINVNVKKYIYEVKGTDFIQHFFLCEWIDGVIGSGNKNEYDINRKDGIQIPQLININELKYLNIVSPPIIKQLLIDIERYGLELSSSMKQIIED